MEAQPHPLQTERLAALRRYEILDTPREAAFDEIVGLAAEICGQPIAVVNLIDRDRQWFKAETGLGLRETPLATSICSHVILEDEYVEIPDTRLDPRTADNGLCLPENGLRFYAGALLRSPEGMPIGTLCVLGHQPAELSALQRRALRVLAGQVMTELDLRLALRTQVILRDEMDHRVKNSLQSVASLVRLYQASAASGDPGDAFDAIARGIASIAALHGSLNLSDEIGEIAMDGYLETVLSHLRASTPTHVTLTHDFAPIVASPRVASAVAMAISEFVANSVKHGFPDGRPGRVHVVMAADSGGFAITCRDDGVGSGRGPERSESARGLGLRLVEASATGIGAHLRQGPAESGFRMEMRVPLPGAAPAS